MRNDQKIHVTDLLPAHANGTLGPRDEEKVREHLRGCPSCRTGLASWEAVRGATVQRSEALPLPDGVMAQVWGQVGEEDAGERRHHRGARVRLSLAWQLLLAQAPLVRRGIWASSAFTMALGCVVALLVAGPAHGGTVLAVFAPVVAAVGVAFLYGPENDPSLELALATPTPPRLVLLARLVLVYGYDLALALVATAVLVLAKDGVGAWALISLWIGPMLFLSALALLLSLLFGANAAILVAMGLWGARLLAESGAGSGRFRTGAASLEALWRADVLLLSLAALLFAAAFLYAPRSGTFARGRAA